MTCLNQSRASEKIWWIIGFVMTKPYFYWSPVHNTPKKVETGVFSLKTHQMFSVHTPLQQSPVILDLFLRKTRTGKSRDHQDVSFSTSSVLWRFQSTLKHKAAVFKFVMFEERFRKVPFWWRVGVDGRPNHRKKVVFLNFSSVLWTWP